MDINHTISRRSFLGGVAALGASVTLGACGGSSSSGASGGAKTGTLNALFMKQAGYSVDNINAMTASFEKANPGIKVNPTYVAYEALHDKIVAAAPAGSYDVVLIDVIWPAEFATKGIVKDVTSRYPGSWKTEMFGGALTTPSYRNKYYGVPWILDTKYLFYNDEMLTKAKVDPSSLNTWDGVLAAAKKIKTAGIVQYPLIWSWSQAEALICDYATLLGAYGGQFLDSSGQPAFDKGGGLQALEFMCQSLQDGLSNPSSTQSLEEDVRKVFSQGQAAIAENWTYMFNLANDPKQSQVAGHAKIMPTPAGPGGKAPGVNGSMALSIAAGTSNTDMAWKYITHLTSQPVQNTYAQYSLPVWKSSYEDQAVIKAAGQPLIGAAKQQLQDLILRPQVPAYNAVSQQLQSEIQNALLGKKTPQQALSDAAKAARDLMKSS